MSPRALRSSAILGGVALAALALLSWSQAWFTVTLASQGTPHPPLSVGGDIAAPALSALAVASAAGFGAIAIAGVFFRVVLAVLEIVLGGAVSLSAILALASPVTAVAPAVTQATSITGTEAVAGLVGSSTATAWPFVGLAAGLLLAVVGVVILATARSWPRSGRRFEAVRMAPADRAEADSRDNSVSDWDELSGGADPTSR